jgi:hypothetical protein
MNLKYINTCISFKDVIKHSPTTHSIIAGVGLKRPWPNLLSQQSLGGTDKSIQAFFMKTNPLFITKQTTRSLPQQAFI